MLNLFCIILYTTFWPNHLLEAHKCPYLQNSIQVRCRNTEAVTKSMLKHGSCYANPRTHMLKHGAATQSKDAYAETRSSCMVRGRRCWNRAITKIRTDAETQWDCHDAETQTPTVSSQGAQFTWLKQPVNCDAETASAAMKRSRYTSCNSDALFSLCISIRLHENRIPYADLERRSELA